MQNELCTPINGGHSQITGFHKRQAAIMQKRHEKTTRYVILAVDGNQHLLERTRQILGSSKECLVVTAESSEFGMKVLECIQVDMVIGDYIIPGCISGLVFLEQVKKNFPNVLTVLQTGYADLPVAMQAINNAGVCKLFEKPWKPMEFADAIINMLDANQIAQDRTSVQDDELKQFENWHPGITRPEWDEECIASSLQRSEAR